MKISDKLQQRTQPVSYSLEYFCPKTEQGVLNLVDRINRMVKLGPLFVDITWNAGGSSSADTTLELVDVCEREIGVDTCMHMTCVGMSVDEVDAALKAAYNSGCRNILALRGDKPTREPSETPQDDAVMADASSASEPFEFNYARDLIQHIRRTYGQEMTIAVAGYPEGHPEEPDPEKLLSYLKEKCDAGADLIVTQMFYNVDIFVEWCQAVRAAGITVPIVPGIMPVSGWSSFLRRARWCQIDLPAAWLAALEPLKHDDAAVRDRGTQLVAEMCRDIVARTDVDHLHFYTMNLEKSPVMTLDALGLVDMDESPPTPKKARLADALGSALAGDSTAVEDDAGEGSAGARNAAEGSTGSHATSHDTSSDAGAASSAVTECGAAGSLPAPTPPAGRSRLRRGSSLSTVKPIHWRNRPTSYISRTATWDEFPNGRWGDSRSPAFNQLNELDVLLKLSSSAAQARWGYPTSAADVGRLVVRYLTNEIGSLPWSDSPAADEVVAISDELRRINDGSTAWFSINSQPALNMVASADPVYGWGPAHGYVFQKANLELMVAPEVWRERLQPMLARVAPHEATYYAVDSHTQELVTNAAPDDVNAITWGIFPGKEVVQPTIVEGTSFLAWKDEAFRIAGEWARIYAPQSPSSRFLREIASDWWLVNIVHHDFADPQALFRLLGLV